MATKINDFAAAARLWQAVGPIETEDTTIMSDPLDLLEGDGPAFAILNVGANAGESQIAGGIEASDDASEWVPVDGAEFPVAIGPGVRAITFTRPKRYIRGVIEIADSAAPITLSLLIGQSRKLL